MNEAQEKIEKIRKKLTEIENEIAECRKILRGEKT